MKRQVLNDYLCMKSDRADLAGLRTFNMVSQRLRRGDEGGDGTNLIIGTKLWLGRSKRFCCAIVVSGHR